MTPNPRAVSSHANPGRGWALVLAALLTLARPSNPADSMPVLNVNGHAPTWVCARFIPTDWVVVSVSIEGLAPVVVILPVNEFDVVHTPLFEPFDSVWRVYYRDWRWRELEASLSSPAPGQKPD